MLDFFILVSQKCPYVQSSQKKNSLSFLFFSFFLYCIPISSIANIPLLMLLISNMMSIQLKDRRNLFDKSNLKCFGWKSG